MMASDGTGRAGRVTEVFRIFLLLGVTSFGGPVAHLGYFRGAFVIRRKWLSEAAYADLVALCQFLPGPSSSQVGMAIGLQRAGVPGMLAAWAAFTLPSAFLLLAFAFGAASLIQVAGAGWIDGLKAAAVAVVAHALMGMARNLTPDKERFAIAVIAGLLAYMVSGVAGQLGAIGFGAMAGWLLLAPPAVAADKDEQPAIVSHATAIAALILFAALLLFLPLLADITRDGTLQTIDRFYRAGSLVFGGGHVVLPLLQAEVVNSGLVEQDAFLAGYGAAQAVPGPLFSFAAYLGALQSQAPSGVAGAAIALAAIYLPSGLLVVGTLPYWNLLRRQQRVQQLLRGVNAGVVGLLAAAFYDPVLLSGIPSSGSAVIAALAFAALSVWRLPAWAVVLAAGAAGFLFL